MENQELVPCVECGHDRSWHHSRDIGRPWTDEEWKIERKGTWNGGTCQWDKNTPLQTPGTKCECTTFKHPDAPRRREAIEHSRRLGL